MNKLVELRNVVKSYFARDQEIPVLRGLDFTLHVGEEICILGASGSGKSTFLHIVGGIEGVTSGEAFFQGISWAELSENEKARIRGSQIGFVFQMHYLIRELTVLENVALPLRLRGVNKKEANDKARYWLKKVGLPDRWQHYPSELSGGELQRTCIARALVIEPLLLLADEPTGSLDSVHARQIQDLLFSLRQEAKMSLIVVTHDLEFASRFRNVKRLADGKWMA